MSFLKRPLSRIKTNRIKLVLGTAAVSVLAVLILLNFRNPLKELDYRLEPEDSVESPHFRRVLGTLMGPPFVSGNRITSFYNGDQIFPAMLEAMRSARKTITFESYIYWSGDVGETFAKALADRAENGVKVHVLIDWVGSQKIDSKFIEIMKTAGVEVERFHPLKWYNIWRMNFRTHRKILVVDGKIGFTGGVGIADEWNGNGLDPKRWRDSHFRAEGPVVHQMQAAFMDNWMKTRPEVHQSDDYFPPLETQGKASAQMFKSSSREGGSSVKIMYLLAIAAARKSIRIESAYFVPDETTIQALVHAKKRGVDIELIVPGDLTDSQVVKHASRDQWGPLLEAGVKIFEYQPAMFHCKVLIVDDYFVSLGSTNFDERSFRLNDEANLNVMDRNFALAETKAFELDRSRSKEVTYDSWSKRPWVDKRIEDFTILFRSQF